jgi:uncharacterized membrane protein SpoIIM required for sporulation
LINQPLQEIGVVVLAAVGGVVLMVPVALFLLFKVLPVLGSIGSLLWDILVSQKKRVCPPMEIVRKNGIN